MLAYKMFDPGQICRGYRFKVGELNVTKEANCAQNGFHCAEDPLDCLSYYPDFEKSECWEVEASGDIHEDGNDSKIACTEMRLLRKLDLTDFLKAALFYMARNPKRKTNSHVQRGKGRASEGFAVVRGKWPAAAGELGDLLAMMDENPLSGEIERMVILQVDGFRFKPGVYYDSHGRERREEDL